MTRESSIEHSNPVARRLRQERFEPRDATARSATPRDFGVPRVATAPGAGMWWRASKVSVLDHDRGGAGGQLASSGATGALAPDCSGYAACLMIARVVSITLVAVLGCAGVRAQAGDDEPVPIVGSTGKLVQLTGDVDATRRIPVLGRTASRAGLRATDLGSSFEHNGRLVFLFGDSVGGVPGADVLAWTQGRDPASLELSFHVDGQRQFVPLSVPGVSLGEFEVPSHGISLGSRMYVVFTTGHTPAVTMGRSVLAVSDDDGRTFARCREFSARHFVNVALVRRTGPPSKHVPIPDPVFVFGSGKYRASSPRLAVISAGDFAQGQSTRYFNGMEDGHPVWGRNESESSVLFDHPVVGEISVTWVEPLARWVMLYNSSAPRGIVMRTAKEAWGPWSPARILFDPWTDAGYANFLHVSWKASRRDGFSDPGREDTWGGEYGPFLVDRFTRGDANRCTLHYTLSTWNPYQVVVMHSDIGYPSRLAPRTVKVRRTIPGAEGWTTVGDKPRRFERAGVPHVSTFGGGDKDRVAMWTTFTPGDDGAVEFTLHGGTGEVVLTLADHPPAPAPNDLGGFHSALKAGAFGRVIEAVSGPSNNDVDVRVRWNTARFRGQALRLFVVDASADRWGFVTVSEIALSEMVPAPPVR